jgi:hypothetical protein
MKKPKRAQKNASKPARTHAAAEAAPTDYEAALALTPYAKQAKAVARKQAKTRKAISTSERSDSYLQYEATALDASSRPAQRVKALQQMTGGVTNSSKSFCSVLKVVTDQEQPSSVRLAALQTLEAASFAVHRFNPHRAEYIAGLRSIAEDADEEVRERVLAALAHESDPHAKELLLAGLKEPAKALLPPERALQLLSYDVHADAYSAARDVAMKPPNEAARRAALRLLAADATSAPLFEKILTDKKESPEIRQLSASALHAIAPDQLQAHARGILLDKNEDDHVKAVSLTALTDLRRPELGPVDDKLYKKVGEMHRDAPSTLLKQSASRFLKKYKR